MTAVTLHLNVLDICPSWLAVNLNCVTVGSYCLCPKHRLPFTSHDFSAYFFFTFCCQYLDCCFCANFGWIAEKMTKMVKLPSTFCRYSPGVSTDLQVAIYK